LRTLGVDPGSRATGYGVLELEGRSLRMLASGVIRPGDGSLAQRLCFIHAGLLELIALWQPQQVALEAVFVANNPRTALVLGQARGAALAAFGQAGLTVIEYTPAEVKGAVVGNGRASKPQVQQMVRAILSLARAPVADAADALAAAICHLHRAPLQAAIAAAEDRGKLAARSPR
jgi:crossover junction endodeoxyribonuclease RuvC